MTDEERSENLFKLRAMMRADEEIRMMAGIVAGSYGGFAELIAEDPDTFDLLYEEVQSILEQLGVEEAM